MDIRFQNLGPEQWRGDVLLCPVCQGEDMVRSCQELDTACPWLAIAPAMRDVTGKKGEVAMVYGHPELNIPRVMILGLGKREDCDAQTLRLAVARGMKRARDLGLKSLLLAEPLLAQLPGGSLRLVEESVQAALLALHRSDSLKKPDADAPVDPEWLAVAFNEQNEAGQDAVRRGERAAQAVARARILAATPGNILFPQTLAEEAQKLANIHGFSCKVLDEDALHEEGMGAMLAVGQGSCHPPRLVVLEHAPRGHEHEAPIVLVGKGITFDSGGISLKPSAKMEQMKSDMSGAAAVLATLAAVADEGLERRVVGILACAENLPGGNASRPGDVVRAANGDSVEITNTDAEGRLVLCDALTYAQKYWQAAAIVDIATLTGACAVALGTGLAGVFGDDAALVERIRAAGHVGGEEYWQLPLWRPYADKLKSGVADICHTGPREGGAINAALFLHHFVGKDVRWAHLDIAGVDWQEAGNALCPAGPTGFGARTLLEVVRGGV